VNKKSRIYAYNKPLQRKKNFDDFRNKPAYGGRKFIDGDGAV
jgi:hypothetical protein